MIDFIKGLFYKGIIFEGMKREEGGPICLAEMSFEYRLSCNVFITLMNIVLLRFFTLKSFNIYEKEKRYGFEKPLAYILIAVLVFTSLGKLYSHSFIFMLNPCHFVSVE